MKNQRYNILFLTPWYPHRYDPMFGLFVERHAEAASMYHNIYVIYCHADDKLNHKKYELVPDKKDGYTALRIYFKPGNSPIGFLRKLQNVIRFYFSWKRGIDYLKKERIEIHLSHVHILTRMGILARLLKRNRRIPYLITEHWSRYQPGNLGYSGWLRKYLTRKVVKDADIVTTVTNHLSKAMKGHKLINKDYRIIYNVVDTDVFKPVIKEKNQIKKIIHISCFEEKSKNLTGIIRTFHQLSLIRKDFQLEMVGEGHDREMAIEYAKKLGVYQKFIFFPGLIEGKDLANKLAHSDFLIQFSHYENLPVVINEAMSCGLPIISSDVGGIREVLTSEKGILVEKGNEDEFKNALSFMIDNYQSYDSEKIRKFAELNFSRKEVGNYLSSLYDEIMKRYR